VWPPMPVLNEVCELVGDCVAQGVYMEGPGVLMEGVRAHINRTR
jgi:hypothetical protein